MSWRERPDAGAQPRKAGFGSAGGVRGWIPLLLIAVIGISLSCAQFLYSTEADKARVADILELRAAWRAQDLEHKIRFSGADAEALASYMSAEHDVTSGHFRDFTRFARRDDIFASRLYWSPWIADPDRDAFATAARRDLGPDYDILDLAPDGSLIPAARRPHYLPHLFEEAPRNTPSINGFDMLLLPGRLDLVESARDSGSPISTPPLDVLLANHLRGFVVLWPVYDTAAIPPTVPERRAGFRGIVSARFRFDRFLAGAIRNTPEITESIDILIGEGANAEHVAMYDPALHGFTIGRGPAPHSPDSVTLRREFDIFRQHWTLVSHFAPAAARPLLSWAPWASLVLGLALTAAMVVLLRREQVRRYSIETAVAERTATLRTEIGERERQEAAARDMAARLQLVVDTALHCVILIDQSGYIQLFNPAAETLFGHAAADVLGRNVKMLMPPPYRDEHDGYLKHYLQTGERKVIGLGRHVTGLRKNGSTFPMDLAVGEARQDETSIFVATIVDLTERQRQEAALRRWADAFDKAAFGIAIVSTQDDRVELVNAKCAAMLGTTAEALRGVCAYELYTPEQRELLAATAAVWDEGGHIAFEAQLLRVDGSSFPAQVDVTIVPDTNGIGSCRIATIFDITDRKRTEAELTESRRRSDELLALLDTLQTEAPVGLGFVDTSYRYVRVNKALAGMNGIPAKDHIGRPLAEILPDLWPQAEPIFRSILEEGRSYINMEMQGKTAIPGDTIGHWLASCYPVRVAGSIIGIGLIVLDVSRQRQIEEQLRQSQKMEAIGNLTGGMAHDFNNPLGVIIGNLDLAQPHVAAMPDVAEAIGEALTASLRGAELTRQLLAFARRQPLRQQVVAINQLVDGMSRLLRRTLGERIRISLKLDSTVWPVETDAAQLEACIVNLATNARDAMPDGGELTIATSNRYLDAEYAEKNQEVTPGDYAVIKVSDTGAGIPPELLTQIFEPFFTTKEPGKGTGLGLSMVFGFIKQSGGHISVYSEVGRGTTFRLYLPRKSGGEREMTPPPADAPPGTNELVLVVEDNAPLRRVALRQLRGLGYRVIEADGADAALRLLAEQPVDLVLTDVVMPGKLDGHGLAREALARWPGIKVLLTSGFPETSANGDLGAFAGSVRLLGKPYRLEELARMVRGVLDS